MKTDYIYTLEQPESLCEQGVRPYSEDYIYPELAMANTTNRLFMVCDGVGGSARGDEASRFVCKNFPELVSAEQASFVAGDYTVDKLNSYLNRQLGVLEKRMTDYVAEHPNCYGMATTLTFLQLTAFGAIVAWAGDSRIYHIRNGVAKFISEDHSLVNELVKRGEITKEEANTHPRKNVILRAVSGKAEPTNLDVRLLNDIQPGDIFFLASDGILDGIAEEALIALLNTSGKTLAQMRDEIKQFCEAHSRDNYSMYLIRIADVTCTTIVGDEASVNFEENRPTQPKQNFSKKLKILAISLFTLLLLGFLLYVYMLNEQTAQPVKKVEKTVDSTSIKKQTKGTKKIDTTKTVVPLDTGTHINNLNTDPDTATSTNQ